MIRIGDNARIRRADERNFALEEKRELYCPRTKKTRVGWVHVGWFGNVKAALQGALKHLSNELADGEDVTIKEVLGRLDGIEQAILNAKFEE